VRPNKLLHIDAMRGWAILMVITVHQALPFKHLFAPLAFLASYGQMGVQLFFVASAFTLCNSMGQREDEKHKLRKFFIRRIFRIAPLYYIGILLFFVLTTGRKLVLHDYRPDGFDFSFSSVMANVFLVHGLVPSAFNNVVVGGWSIGTEMAFYALFPALFASCKKLHARLGWAALLLPLAAFTALNFAVQAVVADIDNNNFWYCFILNQMPVFMVGIVLYFTSQDGLFAPRLARDLPGFLLGTAAAMLLLYRHSYILLPFASAISFAFLFNILRRSETHFGIIEKIGRASYSMYIFHFALAWFATKVLLGVLPPLGAWENLLFPLGLAVTTVLTYLFARLSERYVEHRFIEYGRRLTAL
jgi:peptidoglycan/LPS O-acetylase OafA/YrhL